MSVQVAFAVGKGNKHYVGYRILTAAEVKDAAVGARLLAAHASGGGWSLLEEPLLCIDALCVAEGFVQVDGACIAEVGYGAIRYDCKQHLCGRYPAMHKGTKVPWTAAAPSLKARWDVAPDDVGDRPCLYIRLVRGTARLVCYCPMSPDVARCQCCLILLA